MIDDGRDGAETPPARRRCTVWLGIHRVACAHTIPPASQHAATRQNKKVTEFLKTILGRPVVVKLNSGVDYRGGWVSEKVGGWVSAWVSKWVSAWVGE